MSWPTFTSPAAAWLLLAAVPLVLLYFLKLRRPTKRLSSLVLWQQVLRDERVNSPFKRLRRSVLLFLQLLVLALLVLAAMQPLWQASAGEVERTLVLLDRSASMGALDRAGGRTRMAIAREQVRELIDGLGGSQQLALIAFAKSARLASPFSDNKRFLGAALDDVAVEDQGDDLAPALRMAGALAKTARIDRVLLVSDGNLPEMTGVDLPFSLEYVRVPRAGANIGITKLHASRDVEGGWTVFVEVEATAESPAPASLELRQDGRVIASEPVAPRQGGSERLIFAIDEPERVSLELELKVQGFDALTTDNLALLELEPPRPMRVAVDEKLADFGRVVSAVPDVELVEEGAGVPDLVVGRDDAAMSEAAGVRLLVGAVPRDLTGLIEIGEGGSAVVDWDRTEPLLDHVELSDLMVIDAVSWAPGAGERDLEQRGFEVIVHGSSGPLILRRGRSSEPGQLYAMLFDPARSTLPYRVGFPILSANLVAAAMRAAGLREVPGLQAGVLPAIQVPVDGEYTVRGPEPAASPVVIKSTGDRLLGVRAERCGWYTVASGGTDVLRLGANLLDREESLLVGRERLTFGELSVRAADREVDVAKPLWPTLAAIALVILVLEWWLFRRRAGTKAAPAPASPRRSRLRSAATGIVLTALAAMAAPTMASAQQVTRMQWGFDGKVVTGRFNLLSVTVENQTDQPFRGILALNRSSGVSRLGATIEEECFLAPHSKRLMQFVPFVVTADDSWQLRWTRSRLARVTVPRPFTTRGASCFLSSDEVAEIVPSKMRSFPAAWFPTAPGGASSLTDAVLDHMPEWEETRRVAFMSWLRGGGRLHVLRAVGADYPTFEAELATLNQPADRFRVGSGMVIRYGASRRVVGLHSLDLQTQLPAPGEEPEVEFDSMGLAPLLLQSLQNLIRPQHDWTLIFTAAFIFMLLVGPVHWVLARKYLDYRLSITALLLMIAAFTWLFLLIGARGYGEQTRVLTLSYARPLESGSFDVTQYSNAFVTTGDTYRIEESAEQAVFTTAQIHEPVEGVIENGRNARFVVDMPLFSSRSFIHRALHPLPGFELVPRDWSVEDRLVNLELEIRGGLPPDTSVVTAWATRGGEVVHLTVDPGRMRATHKLDQLPQHLQLEELRQSRLMDVTRWDDGDQNLQIRQRLSNMSHVVIAEHLGLLSEKRAAEFTRRRDVAVFVVAELPDAFKLVTNGLGDEEGYVIYHFDIAER